MATIATKIVVALKEHAAKKEYDGAALEDGG